MKLHTIFHKGGSFLSAIGHLLVFFGKKKKFSSSVHFLNRFFFFHCVGFLKNIYLDTSALDI